MSKKCKHTGKCAVCGQIKQLTLEHIPPKYALNKGKTQIYPLLHHIGTDNMPWDYTNTQYVLSQNGVKTYTLCKQCNNNTGSWYALDYGIFVRQLNKVVQEADPYAEQLYKIKIDSFHPLRVIKQVLTMFCSANSDDVEFIELGKFVSNKELTCLDMNKFRLYAYLYNSNSQKILSKQEKIIHNEDFSKIYEHIVFSEIVTYPIGYILYINPPSNIDNGLTDITEFAQYEYDYQCALELIIPCKERWTDYVGDFRSQDKITPSNECNPKD